MVAKSAAFAPEIMPRGTATVAARDGFAGMDD
jgi:hypothetical protein